MHPFVIISISNSIVNSRNSESQCTTAYNTVTSLVLRVKCEVSSNTTAALKCYFLLRIQLVNLDSFTVQTLINRANQETNTCSARVEPKSAIAIHWSNSVSRDRQRSNVGETLMKFAVSYCLLPWLFSY